MILEMKAWSFLTVCILALLLPSCISNDEPNKETSLIRGYWVCKSNNLALEVISAKDYCSMRGTSGQDHYEPSDNVYQLWYIGKSDAQLYLGWSSIAGGKLTFNDPSFSWRDKVEILSCDDHLLILEGIDIYSFERVSKQYFDLLINRSEDNSNDPNSGNKDDSWNQDENNGDHISYEMPEIGFYDFTAYPTKMTLKFKIFNSNKTLVTGATGYYGTSSPTKAASAVVSSSMITLNLSGLSKGTKYKIKVTAKWPGGTTSSETVTCMTLN